MLDKYRLAHEAVEAQYVALINLDGDCIMGAAKMLVQKKMYKALRRLEDI